MWLPASCYILHVGKYHPHTSAFSFSPCCLGGIQGERRDLRTDLHFPVSQGNHTGMNKPSSLRTHGHMLSAWGGGFSPFLCPCLGQLGVGEYSFRKFPGVHTNLRRTKMLRTACYKESCKGLRLIPFKWKLPQLSLVNNVHHLHTCLHALPL